MKHLYRKILIPVFLGIVVFTSSASASTTFNVDSEYDYAERDEVTATLRKESDYAYFYVGDTYWSGLTSEGRTAFQARLDTLAQEFDENIYPKMHEVYGKEWIPGIDGLSKVFVLLTRLKGGAGGYFNITDEYPVSQMPKSNEREMVYLNADLVTESRIEALLSHEFQHLINFNQKTKLQDLQEEVWLNEALSEYAPTVCGYDDPYQGSNLETRVKNFFKDPSDSLTEWSGDTYDYSPANLFMHYLTDHYSENVLGRLLKSDKKGIENVNEVLGDLGYKDTFSDVFTNWTIANYLNDTTIEDGKYGYLNSHLTYHRLHISPSATYIMFPSTTVNTTVSTKDWAPRWYKFVAGGVMGPSRRDTLKLEFLGEEGTSNFRVPYVITDFEGKSSVKFMNFISRKGSVYIPSFGSNIVSVTMIPSNQYKSSNFTSNEPVAFFSFSASTIGPLEAPQISAVSPLEGNVNGGTAVVIKGSNFLEGASVFFGEKSTQEVSFVDSGTIRAITPPHTAGEVDIEVINPDSQSAKLSDGFTYKTLYPDGSLIRAKGDSRVYVIKGGYKRWIQSPQIFNNYGHLRWEDIIEVTAEERDSYVDSWLIRELNDYKVYEVRADGTKHWLNMTPQQFVSSGWKWEMIYIVNRFERDWYVSGGDVEY